MQLYDIALQGGRDNAGLLANLHLLMGEREAGGLPPASCAPAFLRLSAVPSYGGYPETRSAHPEE